jgi:hypothetical protein
VLKGELKDLEIGRAGLKCPTPGISELTFLTLKLKPTIPLERKNHTNTG